MPGLPSIRSSELAYVTGLAWVDAVGKAHGEAMANARPVATMVVVKDLIDERWKVEIEAEAVIS